jgi:hypothetical protein
MTLPGGQRWFTKKMKNPEFRNHKGKAADWVTVDVKHLAARIMLFL